MRWARRLLIAAGALLALGLPRAATSAAIPDVKYNPATKHWYKLYREKVSWHTARSRAAALRGYLVSITSAAEQQWVWSNLASASGYWALWLGATDEAKEGVWRWVSGEPWNYTNWGSGEPGNVAGIEHYAVLRDDGVWGDRDATGKMGSRSIDRYIVEWNEDPNNTEPPPPPPPPVGTTDLAVLAVSLTPAAPRPGESVEASFTVRNAGDASGPFTAILGLEGHDGDPLAQRNLAGLGKGAARPETLAGRVPDDLPSGEYHATVLVSPTSTREIDPTDNLGRVTRSFRVEQPPVALCPGKLSKILGPLGRQVYTLECFPELRAKLKVKLKKGHGTKRLEREDDETVLAEATERGKLKHTISGQEGRLRLLVESDDARPTRYQVSLKAKAIRFAGEIEIGTDPVELEIRGFDGMTASVKLKGLDGVVPQLDVGDLGDAGAVKTSGSKVKAKGLALEGEGPWTIRIAAPGDAGGRCGYSIRVK